MASYHSTREYYTTAKCEECKKPWLYITKGIVYRDVEEIKCRKHPGKYATIIERNLTKFDAEFRVQIG